ncbi:dockerin type I domain-containing protein, partial [bacterium]|nr:dockerin type I domain-containing protein [bacterium]
DSAAIPLGSVPGDAMIILNHNDAIAEDTNLDGTVTALDALLVINDTSSGVVSGEAMSSPSEEIRLTDVNADGYVTALDALTVLNAISRSSVLEGEAAVSGPEQIRVSGSAPPNRSALDQNEHWARCLDEMDWDAGEEIDVEFRELSGSTVAPALPPLVDSTSADAVFGGERAFRHASALAEDRLDELFSDLDHELGTEERY